MAPPVTRYNYYEPYTVGKNIYRLPQQRFTAQMKFKNNYQKSARFYSMGEARNWIDDNYDELSEIADIDPGADWFPICEQIIFRNQIKRDFNTLPQ